MKKQDSSPSLSLARDTLTGLFMSLFVGVVSSVALSFVVLLLASA